MPKKINYAEMFTLRKDGRYQVKTTRNGKKVTLYDRDPEKLWHKLNDPVEEKPVLFRDIADTWHTNHIEQVAYKTAESYRAPLRRLLERFGKEKAEDVTVQEATAYLSELGKKGFSKRSVKLHRDILNMIYNHSIATGVLKQNPISQAVIPKGLKVTRRELPSDDAINAVKNSAGVPFGLFAMVCLYAGLRRGEALALRYEDIDRERRVINVTKSVGFKSNRSYIKTPKTETGTRQTILLDVLANTIPQGKGYIFCTPNGDLLTERMYKNRWKAYCKAIGHKITAHQLRHGFTTILYEAGIPDKDAQELLGHSSITITRDIYTHIRQSRREKTAEALNKFIAEGVN